MPDPANDYLYHYTTAEGLIGIVKNRKIWATNILYLNDAKEFRHGMELGEKYVQDLYDRAEGKNKQYGAGIKDNGYLKVLVDKVRRLKSSEDALGYVCSFSELEDDLSQWRAYCPRGGFAIGFPKDRLKKIASEHVYRFEQCAYDLAAQRKVIRNYIKAGIKDDSQELAESIKGSKETVKSIHPGYALSYLAIAAATLKDPAFRSEKEWRMVRYPGPDAQKKGLCFRAKHGVIVPYMECNLAFKDEEDAALTKEMWKAVRVTVGPTPNPEASEASVKQMLRIYSPADSPGTVTLTSVPYKFW